MRSIQAPSPVKLYKMSQCLEQDQKVNSDMRSLKSLKQAGMTAVFTGQAKDKMVVLPSEEATLSDIDYLVPTYDEKGQPIAEWRRQVMVRQLQARLQDEESQRRKKNSNRYTSVDSWRYSHTRNAILGPFGEMLTEEDLIYLEKQIENVSMKKNCEGYELELSRLAEELRTILPAPVVNITLNTHFRKASSGSHVTLPVWCNRISGIVKSMSLLMTNLSDQSSRKIQRTELTSVFSQTPGSDTCWGREEMIEKEVHQFGVSVRKLRSNFEGQSSPTVKETDEVLLEPYIPDPINFTIQENPNPEQTEPVSKEYETSLSDKGCEDVTNEIKETTSLRKERIVILFLGHWKKSAYSMTLKSKDVGRKAHLDEDNADVVDQKAKEEAPQESPKSEKTMENGSLSHFFRQRSTINKMICNWRSMNSHVSSKPMNDVQHQRENTYSPEQFLPRLHGDAVDYDNLSLDLFMLGYFYILELDLPADERKMRHLLCYEVFDHVGRFSWETVRSFHKAVIEDIEAGNREWKDGFEDIKLRFFESADTDCLPSPDTEKTSSPEMKRVPKVIIQSPTPDEDDELRGGTDLSCISNEEICKYIDRSFTFWKEKEAEIFDFE